ncbi:MAG TPA: phosphoglycerate dehydrogenase [Candidatus Binatia bacterium]|nr:phosphoglycerate dehydrogenase [Candidatus Binatia bacterium]
MSWHVLITARTLDEVGAGALKLLKGAGCEMIIPPKYGPHRQDTLVPLLEGADAVLASTDQFNRDVLSCKAASKLKLISRWGVGYDSIDAAAATEQGIVVAYVPGVLNEAVADFAFGLLLALARRIHIGHLEMTQGQWRGVWGHDVHGKTIGIIGCGRIGSAMARRASGFSMRLLAYDVCKNAEAEKLGVEFVPLDTLLAEADFVSLHAASTPENRGLIAEAQLRKMKPSAYLINTARGALLDEAAVAKALQERWIAGAALDAFATEPLPADHPLRKAPNILLTPHLASFARETGEKVSMCAAQAIVDLLQGRKPQFIVNPDVFKSPALRVKLK